VRYADGARAPDDPLAPPNLWERCVLAVLPQDALDGAWLPAGSDVVCGLRLVGVCRLRALITRKFQGYAIPERLALDASNKLTIFRSLCRATGLQMACRDYTFGGEADPISEDDVMDVVPVVKASHPRSKDALDLYQRVSGTSAAVEGLWRRALTTVA
jgi:hypothetical protein